MPNRASVRNPWCGKSGAIRGASIPLRRRYVLCWKDLKGKSALPSCVAGRELSVICIIAVSKEIQGLSRLPEWRVRLAGVIETLKTRGVRIPALDRHAHNLKVGGLAPCTFRFRIMRVIRSLE